MIVCNKCGKDNQDHYKFCLGCGSELNLPGEAPPPVEPAPMEPAPPPVEPAPPPMVEPPMVEPPMVEPPMVEPAPPPVVAPPPPPLDPPLAPEPPPQPAIPPGGPLEQPPTSVGIGAVPDVPISPAPPPSVAPFGQVPPLVAPPTEPGAGPLEQGPTVTGLGNADEALSPTPPAGMASFPGPEVSDDAPTIQPPDAKPAEAAEAAGEGDETAYCSNCGTPNPAAFVFCGNCGNRLKVVAQETMYYGKGQEEEEELWGKLFLIRPDGTEGGFHPLQDKEVIIGRSAGALFENDGYLSPEHARLEFEDGTLILGDMGSLNGVFIKITEEEVVQAGDIFRIGQELLRFDPIWDPEPMDDGTQIMGSPNPGFWGRLSLISGPGVDGNAFPCMGDEMVLGRERGDVLFPDDGYISGSHAKLLSRDDGFVLADQGSSNGTFLKLNEPREVPTKTFILLGQQLFRIDIS